MKLTKNLRTAGDCIQLPSSTAGGVVPLIACGVYNNKKSTHACWIKIVRKDLKKTPNKTVLHLQLQR
jgi:hypothetical protein